MAYGGYGGLSNTTGPGSYSGLPTKFPSYTVKQPYGEVQTKSSYTLPSEKEAAEAEKNLIKAFNSSPESRMSHKFLTMDNERLDDIVKNPSSHPDLTPEEHGAAYEEYKNRRDKEEYIKKSERKWSDPSTWLSSDWLLIASTGLDYLSRREQKKYEKEQADRTYEFGYLQFEEQLKLDREKFEFEKSMRGPAITTKSLNVFV